MSKKIFQKVGTVALVAVMAAPFAANAESSFVATGPATARVDFQVTIPTFLSLRVGSTGTTIDRIDFAPSAANLGNSTAVAGTGGNLGGGAVSANVRGNGGNMTLLASTGPLVNALGDLIDWNQISTISSNASGLPAPVLVNSPSTTSVPLTANLANGRVTNLDANWTYSFLNQTVLPEGTYSGRVTYTATMP